MRSPTNIINTLFEIYITYFVCFMVEIERFITHHYRPENRQSFFFAMRSTKFKPEV